MHELVLYHEPCGSRDAHMQPSTTYKGRGGWDNTDTHTQIDTHSEIGNARLTKSVHGRFSAVSHCTGNMITLRLVLLNVPSFRLGFAFIHIKPANTGKQS